MSGAAEREPDPNGVGENVWPHVIHDIMERVNFGYQKYGTFLKVDDGRDGLWDAYQEAIDLVMYLRKEILKREISDVGNGRHNA